MWQAPSEGGSGGSHRSLKQQTTGGWKKKYTPKSTWKGFVLFQAVWALPFEKCIFFSLIRSRVQLIYPTPPPFPVSSCCGGILHQLGCLLYTRWKEKNLWNVQICQQRPLTTLRSWMGNLTTPWGSLPASVWLWSVSSVHRCWSLLQGSLTQRQPWETSPGGKDTCWWGQAVKWPRSAGWVPRASLWPGIPKVWLNLSTRSMLWEWLSQAAHFPSPLPTFSVAHLSWSHLNPHLLHENAIRSSQHQPHPTGNTLAVFSSLHHSP